MWRMPLPAGSRAIAFATPTPWRRELDWRCPHGYDGHVKRATISTAKNRLSALIDLVRKGETVVITDRDQPVAQLGPLPRRAEGDTSRLAELERAGLIRRGRVVRAKQGLLSSLPPMPQTKADLLAALLADRAESR
jgi:prevent-host-death family protein